MSELFEKSIRTLELPSVLQLLAEKAVSDAAKEKALRLLPTTDADDVLRALDETDAARAMIGLWGAPPFTGIHDVRELLARADRGGMLSTHELLRIASLLTGVRRASDYYHKDGKTDPTVLDHLFSSLHPNRYLEEEIKGAIIDEDTIADTASPALLDIRRKMRLAAAKSRQILQRIISSASYAKVLQEALITQRDGRFVVPVKAEHRGDLPGLIHDVSASGATLFVEPMGVVQANNELRELQAKEEKEIDRILMSLSADCASAQENICWDYDILVQLDLIFARGELSYQMNAVRPEIRRRGGIVLRHARHPLLAKPVPIDLTLGDTFDTLVITGPNTGGKTVTLKTIGLLCLMAQCGLHIPADSGSALPVFSAVLADIGDEQSIEQNLSTFSSHMVNIIRILQEAGEGTLTLFDELGAGTDPVEGAALATAIIQHVRTLGALIAATTHYAELKTFAMTTQGVENASCEFDVQTLRPTYRLLLGIPGKSNAFAIAERLGMDSAVIENAKEQITGEAVRFEDVLTQLETRRQTLEKSQTEAEKLKLQREEDARKAREFREQMIRARENARTKGEAEARRIIREAQAQADEIFAQLETLRKVQQQGANFQQVNDARTAVRHSLNAAQEKLSEHREEPVPKPSRPIQTGDLVELPGVRTPAEVKSVNSDGTLLLQAGRMKMTTKASEVRLIEESEQVARQRKKIAECGGTHVETAVHAASELDIRGLETLESESVVENYIASAVMAKLNTVTIIHGKGTGALRKAVWDTLKKNRAVKSFRMGRYGEGEAGVTVVELK
jgi:DNA mismatch repair protein MutS2